MKPYKKHFPGKCPSCPKSFEGERTYRKADFQPVLLLDNETISITGCKDRISPEPVYQEALFPAWIKGNLYIGERASPVPSTGCVCVCTHRMALPCWKTSACHQMGKSMMTQRKERRNGAEGKSLWDGKTIPRACRLQGSSRQETNPVFCMRVLSLEGAAHGWYPPRLRSSYSEGVN